MDSIEVSRHHTPAFGYWKHAATVMGEFDDLNEKKLADLAVEARPVADDLRESEQRIERFLLAGNAGGAAIALTIIGGMIGTSENPTIPWALFWILVCFLVGLLAVWASRFAELLLGSARLEWVFAKEDVKVLKRLDRRFTLRAQVGRAAYIISSVTVIVGVTWGMFFLYRLTAPDS